MNNFEIDQAVAQAEQIAAGSYKKHEETATNHARLQSLLVKTNGELIKTIRSLDAKNSRLQHQVALLSVIATIASIIALLK